MLLVIPTFHKLPTHTNRVTVCVRQWQYSSCSKLRSCRCNELSSNVVGSHCSTQRP